SRGENRNRWLIRAVAIIGCQSEMSSSSGCGVTATDPPAVSGLKISIVVASESGPEIDAITLPGPTVHSRVSRRKATALRCGTSISLGRPVEPDVEAKYMTSDAAALDGG